MKRWLTVTGTVAVVSVAACSSPSLPGPQTATLAADERTSATLNVLTGTTALRIGVADFGISGALLRVSTPTGGPSPRLWEASSSGTQPGQSAVVDLSAPGASAVTVTLNAAVGWRLVLGGGTTRTTADLRGGQVTGIAFTAGSSVISLALPRPHGSVAVQLAGGASQFLLSLPGGVPARVTAAGGAGEVSLEGQDYVGVAGGSVFMTPGWAPGAAGFDINATAGASRVAVTARATG